MNRMELMEKVSQVSGFGISDCDNVLSALEKVLEAELKVSGRKRCIFDTVYGFMTFLKKIREK
ncbi:MULTISPECIES: hypothetical protein [Butyricimonas]|uniref:hypothetical protein n=1 Tax=Butyricimonas TaxID=574697 RepID=UPI001D08E764|nr:MULTISPECIES: hypothetical protein [Butyricimonas]MCB6971548.1 hypothetical protein [Butyricimonas synergistica]MCG4518262.1 hypothetical protein [Butyricimonas sp. DFI.6.44]